MNCRYTLALFSFWALLLAPAMATACAVCLTGAADGSAADAYNGSVLFLMAAPYLVVGAIGGWLVYSYRRAVAKRNATMGHEIRLVRKQKESGR
jgi:hypothetical protein